MGYQSESECIFAAKFGEIGKIPGILRVPDETGGRKRVCDGSPESMHGAAGAPPQLTDGACVAAQSTDVAALRHTLQARPLALRLHRERAIGAKSTDLCAVDFHVGRAQRADNRGSRMLSQTRAHRASGGPGGGRPSSPPERPWPGSGIKGGCFSVRPVFVNLYFVYLDSTPVTPTSSRHQPQDGPSRPRERRRPAAGRWRTRASPARCVRRATTSGLLTESSFHARSGLADATMTSARSINK